MGGVVGRIGSRDGGRCGGGKNSDASGFRSVCGGGANVRAVGLRDEGVVLDRALPSYSELGGSGVGLLVGVKRIWVMGGRVLGGHMMLD